MGAGMSNPFDEASRERVQEIITECMTTFTTEFLKSYKTNLIDQVKSEAIGAAATKRSRTKSFHISSAGEGEFKLVDPPAATAVIKVGALTKRGDLKKNWLKRYFVCLNEANNFDIVYYDHEPNMADFEANAEGVVVPPKKGLKGTMQIAGYSVGKLSGDQVGIELSGNESQRAWFLRADSPQDVAEWMPVFQRAAKEAQAPCDDDPVVHAAFMDAYKETRWSQSLWGSWSVWGAEEDMLGSLVNDILQERIMSDIYDQVPSGPMKNTAIGVIKKTVSGMVRAAASAAWKSATASVAALKGTLMSAAKTVLAPIAEQEPKIIAKVSDGIISTIKPPIEKLCGEVANKIFAVVLEPVALFYVCAVKGFTQVMASQTSALSSDPERKLYRLRAAVWGHGSDSMLQAGGCWAADDALRALAALDALGPILGGKSAASIAFSTTKSVATLLEKSVYDVECAVQTGLGVVPAISTTTGKLVNDCQLLLETFCLEMLGGIIIEPVNEQIKPLIDPVIEPLNEMVPEALKDFFDLQRIASTIVNQSLVTCLKAIVCPALAPHQQKIADAGIAK